MKKWGRWGTLVDVEKIKARKLHMVKFGCFGTEVDADVIEARKQALRDWWTPARRQAASDREKARWTPEMRQEASDAWTPEMRQEASDAWTPEMRQEASDWWTDERRDGQGDLMMKWWDDEEEGVTRREARSLATYYGGAAARGDTDPLDPIMIPAGTVCPKCDNQLGQRVILGVGVRLQKPPTAPKPVLAFRCPHKTCTARCVSLLCASHRAAVLSTSPDGEGGEALEQAIVGRLALVVDTFNAAKRDEATRLGVAFSPVVISAKATGRI